MKKDDTNPVDDLSHSPPAAAPEPQVVVKAEEGKRKCIATSLRLQPLSQIISIRPDVDVPTLLAFASETLEIANAMAVEFSRELDASQRHQLAAIQQLAALAEMLVIGARDRVDPLQLASRPTSPVRH